MFREQEDGPSMLRQTSVSQMPDAVTVCVLILTFIAVVLFLGFFEAVLVPLTYAVFFAQLFEPVLRVLLKAPRACLLCLRKACTCCGPAKLLAGAARDRTKREAASNISGTGALLPTEVALERPLPSIVPGTRASRRLAAAAHFSIEHQDSAAMTGSVCSASTLDEKLQGLSNVYLWVTRAWDIIAMVFCTGLLLGSVSSIIWWISATLEGFDWSKYKDSSRTQEIVHLLNDVGISFQGFDGGFIMKNFRTQVMDALNALLHFSQGMVLTLMMFFFCLLALVPRIHDQRKKHHRKIKRVVQQYLLCKTLVSLLIGCVAGMSLGFLNVDLAGLFGVLTFILNFIPNVGGFFAIIAPIPMAALDPEKDLFQVALVGFIPLIIHNLIGCIIEPKVMADGMDLHPLTIVVALTFWSSVWGIPGAVLSIPITSVVKLWLAELNHPYAKAVCDIFNVDTKDAHSSAENQPISTRFHRDPADVVLMEEGAPGSRISSTEV